MREWRFVATGMAGLAFPALRGTALAPPAVRPDGATTVSVDGTRRHKLVN